MKTTPRKINPPRKVKATLIRAGICIPVIAAKIDRYVIPADEASYEAMKRQVDAAAEKAINRWLANGHPKNRERIPVEILASLSIHPPKRKKGGR